MKPCIICGVPFARHPIGNPACLICQPVYKTCYTSVDEALKHRVPSLNLADAQACLLYERSTSNRKSLVRALETRMRKLGKEVEQFDLVAHLDRQIRFSKKTFGPDKRTQGVIAHIRKELVEIEATPDDLEEWIDVVMLALDGAWRHGHTPEEIVAALTLKLDKNERRSWPDWRTASADQPIEHDRKPGGAA